MQFKIAEFNAGVRKTSILFTIFGTLMVLATASSLLAQNVASRLTNLPLIADYTTALTNPGFSSILETISGSNPPTMPKGERSLVQPRLAVDLRDRRPHLQSRPTRRPGR